MKRKMDHPCHRQQGPAFSSSKDLSTHLLSNMQSPVSKWLKSGKHRPLTLETFGTETGGVAQCGMNIETRKIPQTLREESLQGILCIFCRQKLLGFPQTCKGLLLISSYE
jgi:hypothetical protein